ncbi:MAG: hypothetical protein UZ04_CHB001001706 [Chlorobi bacterium OLB4]|jgi:hypothetical protein|nr:MAG: hypothetical protein UZ04_CHB001001706 [Chlorobi bacterium OLB4]MBW7855952.1 hypothetical protein [Ignavibacteria bacterium]OQY77317.1 MAG: hypothetical protein B6D43_06820 [Ignavibacteriales bacterium UTCHB1]
MNSVYKALYIFGVALIIISIFGGSLFAFLFESLSKNSLEIAGVREEYVTVADNKIDEIIFIEKRFEYRFEQLKSFFSDNKPDERDYQKEKNFIIRNTFYNPIVDIVELFYRLTSFGFAIMVILFGVVFHLLGKLFLYRDKINALELKVYEIEKSSLM